MIHSTFHSLSLIYMKTLSYIFQGLFGSGYFGVGKAVGIFVGGYLVGEFGYNLTWRILSWFSLLIALVFFSTTNKKIKTK